MVKLCSRAVAVLLVSTLVLGHSSEDVSQQRGHSSADRRLTACAGPFTFTGTDFDAFTAPAFVTSSDDAAETSIVLSGTKVSATLVPAPACACP